MLGMLRAEMFKILDSEVPVVDQQPETQLINELIREYMEFSGYSSSLSVFELESNLPSQPMARKDLVRRLNFEGHEESKL